MEWNTMRKFIDSLREQSANTNAPVSFDKNLAMKKAKFDDAQKATDPANATAGGSEPIVKQGDSAETVKEATYSAKAARAGKDIGKPGKNFGKIAKSAGEKYGSAEAGKRVAGAILAKLRKEEVELEEKELSPKQKKIAAVAGDKGKIDAADFAALRAGAKIKEDVDQTISYKSTDVELKESAEYADYFKAALTTLEITSPLDLAEADRADFYALVDECFNTKDDLLFLEAWMRGDVQDKMDMHKKAGNKVTDVVHTNKGGQSYHSFVVTEPSGKRTRHIFHGNSRKLETMSPAPKSKEAQETGEDEDDK